MATQSTKDDEVYKREYQRIKSLVSSAYVRQTSVSHSLSESWECTLWGIASTCASLFKFFLRQTCVSITLLCMWWHMIYSHIHFLSLLRATIYSYEYLLLQRRCSEGSNVIFSSKIIIILRSLRSMLNI